MPCYEETIAQMQLSQINKIIEWKHKIHSEEISAHRDTKQWRMKGTWYGHGMGITVLLLT